VIWGEKIDCEFNWNEGGWDVFLTDEEFSNAKREVERMKAAGGFIASLKIFEGQVAAKVHILHCNLTTGCWGQVLQGGNSDSGKGIITTICSSDFTFTDSYQELPATAAH
jgi:hypothetical protein